jgi:anti-sigma regulatory factor (Ser/Thr protein kinase)
MREEQGQQPAKDDLAPATATLTVPSHPRYLYVIRSALYPLVVDAGFSKREARMIVLAVDEACSNIIKYAYGGDHTKTIIMTVIDDGDSFTVRLRDYGRKVDAAAIAPRDLAEIRPGGLGTRFMAMAFDAVRYDGSVGSGTLLTLEKKKKQQQQVKT